MTAALRAWLGRHLRDWPPLLWGLRLAMYAFTPRQPVGAVGAIFNDDGQVLVVHHVFRTDFPWGLPGGWVKRGEAPAEAVAREALEELKLRLDVGALLLCEQIPALATSAHPPHVGLAYYCRIVSGGPTLTAELLAAEWCDPTRIPHDLAPFQRRAAEIGLQVFQRERRDARLAGVR